MKQLFDWGSIFGYGIDTVFLVGVAGMISTCLLRLYHMNWPMSHSG